MRYLIILLTLFNLTSSHAQEPINENLIKLREAVYENRFEEAESVFKELSDANPQLATQFFWKELDLQAITCKPFADYLTELACKKKEYDQAVDFQQVVVKFTPEDIPIRINYANTLLLAEKEPEAVDQYKQILVLDPNNRKAIVFMGSLLFQKAEQQREQLISQFAKLQNPSRTDLMIHKNELSKLTKTTYQEARTYLEKSLEGNSSEHVKNIINKIDSLAGTKKGIK